MKFTCSALLLNDRMVSSDPHKAIKDIVRLSRYYGSHWVLVNHSRTDDKSHHVIGIGYSVHLTFMLMIASCS